MWTKLTGTVFLLIGCLIPALRKSKQERRSLRQLYALTNLCTLLERQLERSAPPMEQLLSQVQVQSPPELQLFLSKLDLQRLEQQPFFQQWRNAIAQSGLTLQAEEQQQLECVGTVLGSCSVQQQCTVLRQTADFLQRQRQQRLSQLANEEKLRYTLSISAGLLAALVLY